MIDFIYGFFAPWIIYTFILVLHLLLPARKVVGYVRNVNTGELLRYRINGLLVMVVSIGIWVLVGFSGLLPWDWLYTHRWSSLIGSCVLGLLFSFAVVLSVKTTGKNFFTELYLGRAENLQFFHDRVDAKMYLYLAGAIMLALNILSFLAHHILIFGINSSHGVILYSCLFFWFVIDYFIFERVHLYTYDIFAERVGFKLGWGSLVFYPYFYMIGLWATVNLPSPNMSPWLFVVSVIIFFGGWVLSRGSNMQKFYFKTQPEHTFLGIIKPRTLSDSTHTLLCSGFWGVARHINYLGEILMATGLTLALEWPRLWVVWLYPIYYIFLLFPRERADEHRCRKKYGELWTEYVRRVPRRIIPGIY